MPGMLAQYRPFITPLPVWDVWYLFLLPLCLAVGMVYKAIKTPHLETLPRQALVAAGWIVAGLCAAAAVLALIVQIVNR
jgi:hypothetical protein